MSPKTDEGATIVTKLAQMSIEESTSAANGDITDNSDTAHASGENTPRESVDDSGVSLEEVIPIVRDLLAHPHPLNEAWTFWYHNKDISSDWLECLVVIADVTTVEEFFRLFFQLKCPSALTQSQREIYLFRKGIKPSWEDVRNQEGGRWTITIHGSENIDDKWRDLAMALVAEQVGGKYSNDVCGAVMHKRRQGNKFSVWTSDSHTEESYLSIGHDLKEVLDYGKTKTIEYERHKSSDKPNKSAKELRVATL